MKLRLIFMLIGLAFIMPIQGFASDSDLAPIEKVILGDLYYSHDVVISSDVESYSMNTETGFDVQIKKVDLFAGHNSNSNQYGLPSMIIVMDRTTNDYPYINEWKTNRYALILTTKDTDADSENRIRYLTQ